MKFRLTALGLHLLASCAAMTLILGTFYLAWYRWPGWYLADALGVTRVLAGVDLVLGPVLTGIVAAPKKSRRELVRDITVIAAVQLIALGYGCWSLWNGRPLYYAYSEDVLQLVQAYDIDDTERSVAQHSNAPLTPHWYSLPRWIWAPLPQDPTEHDRIVTSAVFGGTDVIAMPRYYQPWDAGLPVLKGQLKKLTDIKYFSPGEKKVLERRIHSAGINSEQANAIAFLGRGRPLLAVFDPETLKIRAFFTSS